MAGTKRFDPQFIDTLARLRHLRRTNAARRAAPVGRIATPGGVVMASGTPRLGRRQFLGRGATGVAAAAVLGPGFLAACGGDDDDDSASGGGGGGSTLRVSNWPFYISEDFVANFEKDSGLSVSYKEDFNDNEEWFAKVKDSLDAGQDIGTDLVIPSEFMVARLIRLEWLDELDDANIPNKGNLRTDLLDSSIDEERKYSLPYMSGMVGLAYNKAATGREITSVDDLWDPEFKGRVSLFSDTQDGLGMVMLSLGDDPTDPSTESVQRAADKVAEEKDKGQIRRFTGNDYADDLTSGNVAIAQAYSGDIVQLQADNPDLDFIVPEAGGTTFVDAMVIPTTTRNKAGAEEWMNYVYDRENYADLIAYVQYVPVLSDMTDALEAVDPEVAANPLVNPPQEILDRLKIWPALTDEQDQEYATIYAEITGE
jgi:spermidine/putrescine transport system substrate-binding protein